MSSKLYHSNQIAVVFCKDFPEVVRKTRRNETFAPEVSLDIVEGMLYVIDNTCLTALAPESYDFIDAKVAQGHTVTSYVRTSDLAAFVPIYDDFLASVAAAISQKLVRKSFPTALAS